MSFSPEIVAVISEYFHDLNELIATFNFTRRGKDKALGIDAAHKVAQGIVDRSASEQASGTGLEFRPNSPAYTAEKRRKYHTELIGFRTGQMISIPSLLGTVDLQPFLVTMQYGTDQPPSRAFIAGASVYPEDRRVTDTQKAGWFTKKKGKFYEPDKNIEREVRDLFAGALDEFIDECNSRK